MKKENVEELLVKTKKENVELKMQFYKEAIELYELLKISKKILKCDEKVSK